MPDSFLLIESSIGWILIHSIYKWPISRAQTAARGDAARRGERSGGRRASFARCSRQCEVVRVASNRDRRSVQTIIISIIIIIVVVVVIAEVRMFVLRLHLSAASISASTGREAPRRTRRCLRRPAIKTHEQPYHSESIYNRRSGLVWSTDSSRRLDGMRCRPQTSADSECQ